MNSISVLGLSGLLVSALSIGLMIRLGIAARWLDMPVSRSLHTVPTPRVGGLGTGLAFALVCLGAGAGLPPPLWVALASVFIVSLIDDRKALPASVRLAVHMVAALVVAGWIHDELVLVAVSALAMAWMANLFNFMDGSDGLAGGMAAIGFATLGGIAQHGGHVIGAPCFIMAGAAVGFLLFNFPPARIFLGDSGSVPMGFLAGALSIWGARDGIWTIWVPMIVFAPFIVDATFTLFSRLAKGARPWEAHREHLYQLWVLQGHGHRSLVAIAYPAMLLCAVLALLLHAGFLPERKLMGPLICLLLATIYLLARRRVAKQSAGAR